MRIIAGLYKGRILKAPKLDDVRPTQDRIKEAMFEIIKPHIAGSDVLELFSGTGSLGIEALSRGADTVTFVERHPLCLKTIEENLDLLGINAPTASVVRSDVFKALKDFTVKGKKFGIIIADPPYGMGHIRKLLIKLNTYDIFKKPFLIVIEHSKRDSIPEKEGKIILLKQYKYGDTVLSVLCLPVLRHNGAGP